MIVELLAIAALPCALGPAALFVSNARDYREPGAVDGVTSPPVSVLIPARNEEESIAGALASVLAGTGAELEVVVMDDGSTDRTGEIVGRMAAADGRLRLEHAPALPAGWNGKQHACWALAHAARSEVLCFVDADVRLEPEAVARMAAFLDRSGAALVSGFPRQEVETTMEWLLLPLIHFVLLGFLPLAKMRSGTDPAFAAGCGQFLMVRRDAYFAAGGHAGIRETMHDGLRLPRLLREHGYRTDLADLTKLARCRMYRSAGEVWLGLAKNATEGIAAPVRIFPITALLLLGQVAPFGLCLWLLGRTPVRPMIWVCVVMAMAGAWLPRVLASWRYRQPPKSAVLHPVGIVALLAVQWYAWGRARAGGAVSWKSRAYAAPETPPPGS